MLQQGVGAEDVEFSVVGHPLGPGRFFIIGNATELLPVALVVDEAVNAEAMGKGLVACFGWMLREAGKVEPERLLAHLRRHAPRMPRTMLRYAIEKLPPARRRKFLAM